MKQHADEIQQWAPRRATAPPAAAPEGQARPLLERAAEEGWAMRDLERAYILHLLARHGGHRGRTAEALGIDRRTLYRKLKEYESDDG